MIYDLRCIKREFIVEKINNFPKIIKKVYQYQGNYYCAGESKNEIILFYEKCILYDIYKKYDNKFDSGDFLRGLMVPCVSKHARKYLKNIVNDILDKFIINLIGILFNDIHNIKSIITYKYKNDDYYWFKKTIFELNEKDSNGSYSLNFNNENIIQKLYFLIKLFSIETFDNEHILILNQYSFDPTFDFAIKNKKYDDVDKLIIEYNYYNNDNEHKQIDIFHIVNNDTQEI